MLRRARADGTLNTIIAASPGARAGLARARRGTRRLFVRDGEEALARLKRARPPAVLVWSVDPAGRLGFASLARARAAQALAPILVLDPADRAEGARVLRLGRMSLLFGPVAPERIRVEAERLVRRRAKRRKR